ncbi:helix-turn-helix domain-containing protein [Guggenheimella bovis]
MAVQYKKLFHLLLDRDMTPAMLQQQAGFSANIISRLKHNEYVSLESIESICRVLSCKVDDILEFTSKEDVIA